MKLTLIGAPGSGKGTQAKFLTDKYNIPLISTGNLLRAAVTAQTPLGRQAKAVMDAGQLVPNDIVIGMIRERITRPDAENGFVLDGFPRNIEQAEALDRLLTELGSPIDVVLQIQVDPDLLMQRMVGRLTCVSCGALFNRFSKPPMMDEQCDLCGGSLHHRSDDNEETIDRRLRVYETQTQPLLARYQQQNKLHSIDGYGEIEEVTKRVKSALRGIRSKRTTFKPTLTTQIVSTTRKAANDKPEIIRTQIEKPKPKPRRRKKASTIVTTAVKRKKKAVKKKVQKKKAMAKKTTTKKVVKKKTAKKKTIKKKTQAKKTIKKAIRKTIKKTAKKKSSVKKAVKKKTIKKNTVKKTAKKAPAKKKVAKKKTVKKKTAKKKNVKKK